jgi:hypothetical protein
MTATTDYDHALELIRRLDRPTQARLVAQVVQELANEQPALAASMSDPRAVLAEIRAHFAKLGPVSPSVGEQLDLDRQHRADFLEGKVRE